jgi:hypothetical protein
VLVAPRSHSNWNTELSGISFGQTSAFLLLLRTRPACLVIDRRLQITRCYRSKRHGRRYRKRTDQYRCDGAVGAQKTFVVVHRPTRQQQMLQAGRVRPASSLREARNLRHALNNAVGRLKDRLIDMAAQQLLQKAFAVLAVTFSAAAASWPRRGRRGTAARRGQSRRLRPRRSDARALCASDVFRECASLRHPHRCD